MSDIGQLLIRLGVSKGPLTAGLAEAKSELSSFGGHVGSVGSVASKSFGVVEQSVAGVERGMGHLKNTMGGLVSGPLGFLGIGAGVLGMTGVLKSGIDTANNMALAIEKMTGLTGQSAEQMSALLAVFGKFNLDTQTTTNIVGFAEKTIGKLVESSAKAGKSAALLADEHRKLGIEVAGGSTKAIDALIKSQTALDALHASAGGISKLGALDKLYGINLETKKGAAVDFQTELLRVSDYYNGNATAGQKAALAAQLFGRGYAQMIPILKLGSKGILEAEQAAKSLGLTLTSANVTDLSNYQATMRNLGDAVGGVQLQLSLALMPAIKDVATAATTFMANNRVGIVAFFDTLIADSRTAAGFITGTVIPDLQSLAGAATGFWNQIPPQLRDILVKGFVADRAMKFLFGFDPVTAIGSTIGKQLLSTLGGGIAGIFGKVAATVAGSKAIPQDVFVVNMIPGGLAGAAAGEGAAAAGGTADMAAVAGGFMTAGVLTTAAAVVIPLAVAYLIANSIGPKTPTELKTAFGGGSAPPGRGGLGGNFAGATYDNNGHLISLNAGGGSTLPTVQPWQPGQVSMTVNALSAIKEGVNHLNAAQLRVEQAMLQRFAHQDAKKALGDPVAFLTALRTGGAATAIKDFPKHLAYMETASAQQKQSLVYARGLQNDIAALKRESVGATNAQKAAINVDLVNLQALVMATTAAVKGVTLTVNQISAIKEVPAGSPGRSTAPVVHHTNIRLEVDGHVLAQVVDRHLFGSASGFSSGFQAPSGVTGA
jgi:hypothetical protein